MAVRISAVLTLSDQFTKVFGKVKQRTERDVKALTKTFALLGVGAAAAFLKIADNMIVLENRLKAVTDSTEEAESAFVGLVKLSKETRSSISSNAQAFQRFTIATETMGSTQEEVLDLTRQLNLAIKLSGTTAKEANAGMIQFAQGLGSGALRGDELRSVLEQMPVVAKVIAKGFGVATDQLKRLGEKGLLVSKGIVKAFSDASPDLEAAFAKLTPTIGDSLTVAFDQFSVLVKSINELFGISGLVTSVIKDLTEAMSGAVDFLNRREKRAADEAERRAGKPGTSRADLGPLRPGEIPGSLGPGTDVNQLRQMVGEDAAGKLLIERAMAVLNQSAPIRRTGLEPGGMPFKPFFSEGPTPRDASNDPTTADFIARATPPDPKLLTEWQKAVASVKEEYSDLNLRVQGLGGTVDAFQGNVSDGLFDLQSGAKTAKEAFTDMANSMIEDLSRLIIKLLVAKAIQGTLNAFFPGGGTAAAFSTDVLTQDGRVVQDNSGRSSRKPSSAEGGFVRPGEIVQATLHGGAFGEEISPLGPGGLGGGGRGVTVTNVYNITALDVADFDRKILDSNARSSTELSGIIAARSRNSAPLRSALGIG